MPDLASATHLLTAHPEYSSDAPPSIITRNGEGAKSDSSLNLPRIITSTVTNGVPCDMASSHTDTSSHVEPHSVGTSSSMWVEDDPDAPDSAIIDALKSAKERLFVLKLGEQMESLIQDRRPSFDSLPSTSYQRMLVHRCAAYYRLAQETDGVSKAVIVTLAPESRLPVVRMADLVPAESSPSPAFKIMRRSATDRVNPRKSRSNSAEPDSDEGQGSEAGSSGRTGGLTHKKKQRMTIAEREAAYNEARSRIFHGHEDREGIVASASSSSQSLATPSVPGDSAASVTSNSDDIGPTTPSESPVTKNGSKNGSKRNGNSKERWNDAVRPSSSTSFTADDPEFNRNGFSYPSLYEPSSSSGFDPSAYPAAHTDPSQPRDVSAGPGPYVMYPSYAGYPPPYLTPYPYYGYDPRQFPYPPPPPDTQNASMVSPTASNGTSPYSAYTQGVTWYMPQGGPPAPAPQPLSMVQPPQRNTQIQPPHPSRDSQFQPQQYFAPPVSQAYFYSQQNSPLHEHPQQPAGPRTGMMYSPQEENSQARAQDCRPSPSSRSSSRSASTHDFSGTLNSRVRVNGLNNTGGGPPSLSRNAWTYGPGLSIPSLRGDRRRTASSSSRAGSVSSRSGSGSGGAMTPGDETGSIASSETSSSSSRKTFTSTSSKHPLPARPDWAIGLPPVRHSHSHHSRASSSSNSTPSVLQSITDFPPLSAGSVPGKISSAPASVSNSGNNGPGLSDGALGTNGVWKSASTTRSLLLPPGSASDTPENQSHRVTNGNGTSGGVTLGVSPGAGALPTTLPPLTFPPPNRPFGTTAASPMSAQSPPPIHRVPSVNTRLDEHDHSFNRPPPKSAELFNPKNTRRSTGGSVNGGSGEKEKEKTGQGAKTNGGEYDDRLRGEAVANAILVDKLTTLQISGNASSGNSNGSGAEDVTGRRLALSPPSSSGQNNSSGAGRLTMAAIEGLTLPVALAE